MFLAPLLMSGAGKLISSMTGSAAKNRGEKLSAEMDADTMRMRQAAENRTAESDAMRKLAQTGYLRRGGASFTPSGPYSPSFGPTGASPEQQQAATMMEQELLRRVRNPAQVSNYNKTMQPSIWERIGNVAGPLLSFGGMAMQGRTSGAGGNSPLPGQIDYRG